MGVFYVPCAVRAIVWWAVRPCEFGTTGISRGGVGRERKLRRSHAWIPAWPLWRLQRGLWRCVSSFDASRYSRAFAYGQNTVLSVPMVIPSVKDLEHPSRALSLTMSRCLCSASPRRTRRRDHWDRAGRGRSVPIPIHWRPKARTFLPLAPTGARLPSRTSSFFEPSWRLAHWFAFVHDLQIPCAGSHPSSTSCHPPSALPAPDHVAANIE